MTEEWRLYFATDHGLAERRFQKRRYAFVIFVPDRNRLRLRVYCQRDELYGQSPLSHCAACGDGDWHSLLFSADLRGCGDNCGAERASVCV